MRTFLMVRPLFGLGVSSLISSVNQCNFQVLGPLTNSCVFSYHLVSHTSRLITTVKLTKGEQVKYAFGTVVSCDHCSVPVSH